MDLKDQVAYRGLKDQVDRRVLEVMQPVMYQVLRDQVAHKDQVDRRVLEVMQVVQVVHQDQ